MLGSYHGHHTKASAERSPTGTVENVTTEHAEDIRSSSSEAASRLVAARDSQLLAVKPALAFVLHVHVNDNVAVFLKSLIRVDWPD